jgi:hypothetical protein
MVYATILNVKNLCHPGNALVWSSLASSGTLGKESHVGMACVANCQDETGVEFRNPVRSVDSSVQRSEVSKAPQCTLSNP